LPIISNAENRETNPTSAAHLDSEGGDDVSKADVTEVFNGIYSETYAATARFIASKCGSAHDIADIIQDTYIEVYTTLLRKGETYPKNAAAFVRQVARTKVYRHYTLAERLRLLLPLTVTNDEGDETPLTDFEPPKEDIEEKLVDRLLIDSIWDRLSHEPDDVQRIFYLYFALDRSIPEIADDLRISRSNVKNKLYRTLKALRTLYGKESGSYG
jgi:RNA polymerase sigma factor (sigma-70 family)